MNVAASSAPQEPFTGPNLNVTLSCPECKTYPPDLIERFSEGDIVCGSCGLVLSDRVVDTRSEWRTFSNDDRNGEDPNRVGDASNPLLDSEDLSTMISYIPNDGRAGRDLSRAQLKSAIDRKDSSLVSAYSKISHMCEGYQLPRVVQDASKEIYKLVHDEKRLRGKSQESIMAASICLGCRKANVGRSFLEIAALTNVPKKELGRVFKTMIQLLQEKHSSNPDVMHMTQQPVSSTSAEDLIRRFCSHLGLSTQISNAAEYIARRCKDEQILSGRSPITVAATVIYMASLVFNVDVSPARIADKAGVSDGTIKTSYKVLFEEKDKILDPLWKVDKMKLGE